MQTYCINSDATILDALKKLDASGLGICLVADIDGRLTGTLSDGDIRRALIKGASLSCAVSAHVNRNFYAVSPCASRAEVLEIMQARKFSQIPIIDAAGKLKGLHLLHSLISQRVKDNWAVIMAGGKGTRLGKLTASIPKPMLKVAGRPILERIILHLIGHGIKNIFIAVNHLSNIIEDYFKDGSAWGCNIMYLREDEPLGSGGALSLLPSVAELPVILMNGDLIVETDLDSMLQFHEQNNYFATMGVHYYNHEVPFGCIEIENNRIVALEEKPLLSKVINAGVYVLSPDAVNSIPKNTFFPITTLFENALAEKSPCGAYYLDGDWMDVGQLEQLRQARGQ
jgi:dTDP-glucose pyrophosphorylase